MDRALLDNIGNQCLKKADEMLSAETVPTADTASTVKDLVETAISVEVLNLRLTEQSRFAARACTKQPTSNI